MEQTLIDSDRTPGKDLEEYLNSHYGPGSRIYEDLCSLTRQGLNEGWLANIEIDGPKYKRSKISLPCAEKKFFSITAVHVIFRLLLKPLLTTSIDTCPARFHTQANIIRIHMARSIALSSSTRRPS